MKKIIAVLMVLALTAVCLCACGNKDTKEAKRKQYAVGKTVEFGRYEQDGNDKNGKEKIEWIVLDRDGDNALLISKYALDCMEKQENDKFKDYEWEGWRVRQWLNGAFYDAAFSADEKEYINTTVTDAEKETEDKVFVLSVEEAKKYYKDRDDRTCEPTEYAEKQGVYTASNGSCWWWLRSPGDYNRVCWEGSIHSGDFTKDYVDFGIRPVIRVKLFK